MDETDKFSEFLQDHDFFDLIKAEIDKMLCDIKKNIDSLNQMRVEATQLESELMLILDANSWENIAAFIGHTPQQFTAFDIKKDH